ncbi:TolC family protein [Echinicola vietnamensis]|uniref:Outer membrane protein n=1 Tax=Echinicola vietnamensis (strain DSM 17526 / LMG 23754 / KMM 6221) TaxID=926556 RepID=L0G6Y9_ECHVK|nr:TolC family protein [Echinicola vietnamensis]AGA80610.1 outer membrane protein [Echinicola vietnamensis DSM 17526]
MRLTTKFSLFGVLLTCLLAGRVSAQEVLEFTLEESVQYALENNADAKNALLETFASKASVGEQVAQGLPQINGSFDFTKNVSIPVMFLPNEGPFADPDNPSDVLPVQFGVNYQSGITVTVNQMIFDGSYFVGLKAARTYRQLSEFDKEKTENDVIENVKKAFFTVLVNKERQELAEANLARIDTLLQETTALYEEGFAEKIEVSRVKVQYNNIRTELDKINAATEISKQLLKVQMGLPIEYEISVTESLRDLNQPQQIQELLDNPGYRRVEMDQLQTNWELVKLDLKNNTVQYLPSLNANFTYQRNGAGQEFNTVWDSENWFTGAFVGLTLNVPIFDGLAKAKRIQQNRIQLQQIENQMDMLDDNIEVERFQARTNLQNNLKTLDVQRENMELATEVYEISRIKYSEGVGSNLEVVEADSDLVEAEINYYSALYDALISKVDLEKALGILR